MQFLLFLNIYPNAAKDGMCVHAQLHRRLSLGGVSEHSITNRTFEFGFEFVSFFLENLGYKQFHSINNYILKSIIICVRQHDSPTIIFCVAVHTHIEFSLLIIHVDVSTSA